MASADANTALSSIGRRVTEATDCEAATHLTGEPADKHSKGRGSTSVCSGFTPGNIVSMSKPLSKNCLAPDQMLCSR